MDDYLQRQNKRAIASAQRDYETPPDEPDGPYASDVVKAAQAAGVVARAALDDSKAAQAQARRDLDGLLALVDVEADIVQVLDLTDKVTAEADAAAEASRSSVEVIRYAMAAIDSAIEAVTLEAEANDSGDPDDWDAVGDQVVEIWEKADGDRQSAEDAAAQVQTKTAEVFRIAQEIADAEVIVSVDQVPAADAWDLTPRGDKTFVLSEQEVGDKVVGQTLTAVRGQIADSPDRLVIGDLQTAPTVDRLGDTHIRIGRPVVQLLIESVTTIVARARSAAVEAEAAERRSNEAIEAAGILASDDACAAAQGTTEAARNAWTAAKTASKAYGEALASEDAKDGDGFLAAHKRAFAALGDALQGRADATDGADLVARTLAAADRKDGDK
jgi:hypothetical protein